MQDICKRDTENCRTHLNMMQASIQQRLVDSSSKPAWRICKAGRLPYA